MRLKLIAAALFALGSIGGAFSANSFAQTAGTPPDTFESVKEYLLDSAATDFYEHQPPLPAQFRKVRIGKDRKNSMYRLCGEFLPANEGSKAKWIDFVTIKTSKYEQYIGSSTTYCSDPTIVWAKTGDLSATLQKRLDKIRSGKQR